MSSICFFTLRNSQGKAPTNSFTYQSKAQLVIRHMHPVALATWDYFLVENISEEWDLPRKASPPQKHVLFIQCATWSGLFWFLFNVSSEDQHVRVCFVAILVFLSAFLSPSLSLSPSFPFSPLSFPP